MKANRSLDFLHIPLALILCTAGPAVAAIETDETGDAGASFRACVSDLGDRAIRAGVRATTVDTHLPGISFIERVIELDRHQPEFTTTFADYLGRRVTQERVERGREALEEHRALLENLSAEYGVPPQYLVAFWGLETNYGSYTGNMPVLDSLATLACDGRRGEFFSRELIAALEILDDDAIPVERMRGSWAGAMGHVQFMPSVFRRYAIDRDGSGRRDLWGSTEDAMASAANFLRELGWERGYRWGREVSLPDGFPYAEIGRDTRKSLAQWRELGVTTAWGHPLPDVDIQASVLLPAGHRGPAFLVYDNFRIIMGWNPSEFYALSVGHLADRIAGAGELRHAPPADAPRLTRAQVMALQKRLNDKGFISGVPDGIAGPMTRRAVSQFQQAHELVPDGFLSAEVLYLLDVSPEES